MTRAAESILADCRARDIHLSVDSGSLRFKASTGALTDELRDRLRIHKPALIQALESKLEGYVRCVDCAKFHQGFCKHFEIRPDVPDMKVRICGPYEAPRKER